MWQTHTPFTGRKRSRCRPCNLFNPLNYGSPDHSLKCKQDKDIRWKENASSLSDTPSLYILIQEILIYFRKFFYTSISLNNLYFFSYPYTCVKTSYSLFAQKDYATCDLSHCFLFSSNNSSQSSFHMCDYRSTSFSTMYRYSTE